MKKFINRILSSKSFKMTMINILYSNPTLTSGDYLRLSKIARELNQEMPTEVQLKKAS
ncbi:hypothetical protein CLPUN_04810 [Clostridium puniceum]|uniref:Uncharacterized protein n=1 Tax=Clostridium puniceum TaxID=29367 RepID=A0A1S8TX40_9CLOT|nr:hypothetical protein [Clostridium puniceum]OOM82142.1 hypothetical protein CLPUN_04810 [Clostridium puniceum]